MNPHYRRQTCSLGTLVSGSTRFMRIFAGVPWRGGIKRQCCCRQRQFSVSALPITLETLEIRPTLLYSDMESLVSFPLIPKHVTLSDLEWLVHVNFCFVHVGPKLLSLDFENNCIKRNIDRLIDPCYQQMSCSLETLVSGNIKFMRTVAGVLWEEGVKRQWSRL